MKQNKRQIFKLGSLVLLVGLFLAFLVGCVDGSSQAAGRIEKAIEEINIELAEGDTKDSVTADFSVQLLANGLQVQWFSSDEAVISITNGLAVVTTPGRDTTVYLTAKVGVNGIFDYKSFKLNVLGDPQHIEYFEVRFMVDGVQFGEVQFVEKGKDALAPQKPFKEGHRFAGWDKDFTNVSQDLIVNGTFEEGGFIVKFFVDGVQYGPTQRVLFGDSAQTPADPSKYGHTFVKWDRQFIVVIDDIDVHAVFEAIPKYTVTFKDFDGTTLKTEEVYKNEGASAPASPTRVGYTFTGWDKQFDVVTSNLTVNAQYSVNEYSITYKVQGQSDVIVNVDFGAAITPYEAPDKVGHTLVWDKTVPQTMPAENLVFVGTYTINKYEVVYKVAGMDDIVKEFEFGQTITIEANLVKAGYTFAWDPLTLPATMPAENLEVIGTFTPIVYTITYNGLISETHTNPFEYTVEDNITLTPPSERDGYVFKGWFDGETKVNTIVGSTGHLVLEAKWEEELFTVTVEGEGYTSNPETLTGLKKDNQITFTFERTGYILLKVMLDDVVIDVIDNEYVLTVTGNHVLTIEWEEIIVLPTIDEVRDLAKGTETEFIGVVTGFTDYSEQYSNFDKVFIEDSTGAIVVYQAGFPQDLKVGDRYKVTGKLDSYSGLIQIARGATVEKLESDIELIAPVEVIDLTEIDETYQAKRVDLEGTVVSVSSNGQSLVVKVGENQITVRSNSNSMEHTVNSHLLTAIVGQVVKLSGLYVDWFNGAQLLPTSAEQIEFVMPGNEELAQLVLDAIVNEWENKSFNMGTDATLPQTGDHDSTITWTFVPEGAIVEGKWSDVAADTTYAVTVVVAIDDVEVSEVFNITVKFVDEGQEGNTFIETFGQVAGGQTSYTTEETYVSTDNGFTWSMKGRNDQTLDGKAWALGNAGDGSFVQVVATGGIKSFSLDVVRAFGNSNARTLELFVNNVSYGTFSVSTSSDDKQVWEVDNINVLGNVTIKVISINTGSRGATIIDNFTWSEYVDVVEPPVQHIVTFDSDGGSDVPAQTINEGSKATKPTNPTKEGFDFLGWFIGENEFDFDTLITEAITLTAHWEEAEPVVEYTITFYDEEGILLETLVVLEGEMPSPQTPTKAETATHKFEFDGWDPELVVASEDAIYHATFKATEKVLYDYNETFDASNATTAYGDGSFTGVNGVVWTYVHSRNEGLGTAEDYSIDGNGIMLRRADEPSSLSATFTNGVGEFSFQYRKAFTGGTNNRNYKVDVTNNGITTTYTIPTFGASGTDETVHTFAQEINLEGEVVIKIYVTGQTGNRQATFDNFAWTEHGDVVEPIPTLEDIVDSVWGDINLVWQSFEPAKLNKVDGTTLAIEIEEGSYKLYDLILGEDSSYFENLVEAIRNSGATSAVVGGKHIDIASEELGTDIARAIYELADLQVGAKDAELHMIAGMQFEVEVFVEDESLGQIVFKFSEMATLEEIVNGVWDTINLPWQDFEPVKLSKENDTTLGIEIEEGNYKLYDLILGDDTNYYNLLIQAIRDSGATSARINGSKVVDINDPELGTEVARAIYQLADLEVGAADAELHMIAGMEFKVEVFVLDVNRGEITFKFMPLTSVEEITEAVWTEIEAFWQDFEVVTLNKVNDTTLEIEIENGSYKLYDLILGEDSNYYENLVSAIRSSGATSAIVGGKHIDIASEELGTDIARAIYELAELEVGAKDAELHMIAGKQFEVEVFAKGTSRGVVTFQFGTIITIEEVVDSVWEVIKEPWKAFEAVTLDKIDETTLEIEIENGNYKLYGLILGVDSTYYDSLIQAVKNSGATSVIINGQEIDIASEELGTEVARAIYQLADLEVGAKDAELHMIAGMQFEVEVLVKGVNQGTLTFRFGALTTLEEVVDSVWGDINLYWQSFEPAKLNKVDGTTLAIEIEEGTYKLYDLILGDDSNYFENLVEAIRNSGATSAIVGGKRIDIASEELGTEVARAIYQLAELEVGAKDAELHMIAGMQFEVEVLVSGVSQGIVTFKFGALATVEEITDAVWTDIEEEWESFEPVALEKIDETTLGIGIQEGHYKLYDLILGDDFNYYDSLIQAVRNSGATSVIIDGKEIDIASEELGTEVARAIYQLADLEVGAKDAELHMIAGMQFEVEVLVSGVSQGIVTFSFGTIPTQQEIVDAVWADLLVNWQNYEPVELNKIGDDKLEIEIADGNYSIYELIFGSDQDYYQSLLQAVRDSGATSAIINGVKHIDINDEEFGTEVAKAIYQLSGLTVGATEAKLWMIAGMEFEIQIFASGMDRGILTFSFGAIPTLEEITEAVWEDIDEAWGDFEAVTLLPLNETTLGIEIADGNYSIYELIFGSDQDYYQSLLQAVRDSGATSAIINGVKHIDINDEEFGTEVAKAIYQLSGLTVGATEAKLWMIAGMTFTIEVFASGVSQGDLSFEFASIPTQQEIVDSVWEDLLVDWADFEPVELNRIGDDKLEIGIEDGHYKLYDLIFGSDTSYYEALLQAVRDSGVTSAIINGAKHIDINDEEFGTEVAKAIYQLSGLTVGATEAELWMIAGMEFEIQMFASGMDRGVLTFTFGIPTAMTVDSVEELHFAIDKQVKNITLGADVTLDNDLAIGYQVNINTLENTLNLGGYSLTFSETAELANYTIVGIFTNGEIIINNSKGHFELDGHAGTDANITILNSAATTVILTGNWGVVDNQDTNGRTIVEATIQELVTAQDTVTVVHSTKGNIINETEQEGIILDEFAQQSLGATFEAAKLYEYSDFDYSTEFIFDGFTITGSYLKAEVLNGLALNDLARFLGALYRVEHSSVVSIEYKDVLYTWNEAGTLKGSNWESEGTTLVSVITSDFLQQGLSPSSTIELTIRTKDGFSEEIKFIVLIEQVTITYSTEEEPVKHWKGEVLNKPVDPTKEGHTFSKWLSNDVEFIFGVELFDDLELVADWTINTFEIIWKNHDGEVLETDESVEWNTTPSFDGETPIKEATAQYTYTFSGWSPEVGPATIDQVYVAQFSETVNIYTITWIVEGVKTEVQLEYGAMPEFDGTLTKEATESHTFEFKGWNPVVVEVVGAATYVAEFNEIINKYKVVFKDYDGTVLKEETVEHGSAATKPVVDPTREGYNFDGWDKTFDNVTNDLVVTATYQIKTFTITWKNHNDEVLETDLFVEWNTTPSFDGVTPTKEATAQYTYTFSGWSPEVGPATIDQVYVAQFSETVNIYTITWIVEGVKTEVQLEYGAMPEFAGTPTKEATESHTFEFKGWNPVVVEVVGAAEYVAEFNEIINKYEVVFKDYDGTVLKEETVEHGSSATAPTPPEKVGYTFDKWDVAFENVTSNLTVKAVYNINTYTVTFIADGGTPEPESINVEHSLTIKLPSISKDGYEFIGWYYDDEFNDMFTENTPVNSNLTLYALFEELYTVTVEGEGYTSNPETLTGLKKDNKITFTFERTGYILLKVMLDDVDIDVIDNEYILTVTGNHVLTIEWEVAYLSIAEARAKATGEEVKIMGIVTGFERDSIYIEDETGSFFIYIPEPNSAQIGDKIAVSGEKGLYNGLHQVAAGGTVTVISSGHQVSEPNVLTELPEFTIDQQSQRFSINGLTVVSISDQNLVVTDGTTQITVRAATDSGEIYNHINSFSVGQQVNIIGMHLGWFYNPQFSINNVSELELRTLTDNEKIEELKLILDAYKEQTYDMGTAVPFITAYPEYDITTISWTYNPVEAVVDGKFVAPNNEDQSVTATAAFTVGEIEATHEFIFTVKYIETGSLVEQLVYETGFEASEGFTSTTNYQAGMEKNGWTVIDGTVTETAASADDMHLQMRLYSGRSISATYNSETLKNISKVTFNAFISNGGSSLTIQFSLDNENWSAGTKVTLTSSDKEYTVISDLEGASYVRWVTEDANPSSGNNKRYNLDDVKIYSMVEFNPAEQDIEAIDFDKYTDITNNLALPTTGTINGSSISWSSNNTATISETGVVTPPEYTETVILTAIASDGTNTYEKEFTFTVLGVRTRVEPLLEEIDIPSKTDVDLDLPMTTLDGDSITWTSSNTEVITNEGVVTRPTEENASVILTATVVEGGYTITKTFDVLVVAEGGIVLDPKTYIETFSKVTSSSSYTDEQEYTSDDNEFVWSLRGRGDQTLDGKAWTLGNAGDGSFVQVVATGGIKSFSLDVVRAYTNSHARTLELFVNDVSYGTFSVSTSSDIKQVWEVDNINVLGNVTIKVISTNTGSRGATIIDNFTWTEYLDVVEPPVQHTVTFDSDGGSDVPAQTINEGGKATKPADPTKEGFDFLGWFIGENEFDFDTLITEAITLIAKWEEKQDVPTDDDLAQLVLDGIINEWSEKEFNMGAKVTLPLEGESNSTIAWSFDPHDAIIDGKWSDVLSNTTYVVTVIVTINETEVSGTFNVVVRLVEEVTVNKAKLDGDMFSVALGTTDNTVLTEGISHASTDYAEGLGLDSSIFTVKLVKNAASMWAANGGVLRGYYNSNGGNEIIITVKEGYSIIDITINLKGANNAGNNNLSVNGVNYDFNINDKSTGTAAINIEGLNTDSVAIQSTHTNRMYIHTIDISFVNQDETEPELTDQEKVQQTIADLLDQWDNESFNMDTLVELPSTGAHGTTITWTTNPTDAITGGKWKVVTENTTVILTAIVTLGQITEHQEISITVMFVDESEQEQVLLMQSDFVAYTNSTQTSYSTEHTGNINKGTLDPLTGNDSWTFKGGNASFSNASMRMGAKNVAATYATPNHYLKTNFKLSNINKVVINVNSIRSNTKIYIQASNDDSTWEDVASFVTSDSGDIIIENFTVVGENYIRIVFENSSSTNSNGWLLYLNTITFYGRPN